MSLPCVLCESFHPASFHCEECEQDMCEVMCKAHLKANVSKNHHLLSIDYDSEKWVEGYPLFCFTASDIQCPSHYLPYRYYDGVCKLRLCIDCYVLAHSRHACKSIAESLIEKKAECVEMLRSKTNELEVVNSLLHETEKRAATLQVEQTQTKTKIANAFQQVFERLQDRQQRLLQEVDSTYGERILLWTERKLKLEEMIEEMKQTEIKFRKVFDLPCAAVVPFIQGGEAKSSMDSELQLMNQEFALYSSLLAKTDLDAKRLMMITTDLEGNGRNLSRFTKFIKSIENIGTELQMEDLEPWNETPAKSAPLYLNYPPHKTISPLTSALRLSEGKSYSISSNGQEAVGAGIWGLRSWCQINPFPTGRSIILQAEFGTNSCLLFTLFHTSDIIDGEILESAMCGVCSWHVSSNSFYQRGVKVKAVNKVDLQPADLFRFELKSQEFKCYSNNELLHVFGIDEGEYRLVIYTYYPDTKIKIIA